MFELEYKGGTSVVITTKKSKLVSDPLLESYGLKNVDIAGAISLATEARFAIEDKGERLAVEGPGEYEVGDFSIKGVAAQRHLDAEDQGMQATAYRVEVGDVTIALLGNVIGKLDEDQLEDIGVVDILVVPVGGGGIAPDATSAARLTRQIDPKLVIPTHYADGAVKYEIPQDDLETFIKELGAPLESTSKLKVKGSSQLPASLTTVQVTRS